MWEDTLREKIAELELIASWASQTQFGPVRDHCRLAKADLQYALDNWLKQTGKKD